MRPSSTVLVACFCLPILANVGLVKAQGNPLPSWETGGGRIPDSSDDASVADGVETSPSTLSETELVAEVGAMRERLRERRSTGNLGAGLTVTELSRLQVIANHSDAERLLDLALSVSSLVEYNRRDPRLMSDGDVRLATERLIPYMVLYLIGDLCADAGLAFNAAEVLVMEKTIRNAIDTVELSSANIDKAWGASSAAIESQRQLATVEDCVETRQTAGFAFAFASRATPNPFAR